MARWLLLVLLVLGHAQDASALSLVHRDHRARVMAQREAAKAYDPEPSVSHAFKKALSVHKVKTPHHLHQLEQNGEANNRIAVSSAAGASGGLSVAKTGIGGLTGNHSMAAAGVGAMLGSVGGYLISKHQANVPVSQTTPTDAVNGASSDARPGAAPVVAHKTHRHDSGSPATRDVGTQKSATPALSEAAEALGLDIRGGGGGDDDIPSRSYPNLPESPEDIAKYGVCLEEFVAITSECEQITGRLTDYYAKAYKTEMEIMARAFKRGRSREAMLYTGLGASGDQVMNPVVKHLTQRAKVQTSFACQNEGHACSSAGISEAVVDAAVGADPMCPLNLLKDPNFGTDFGMQKRMGQLIDAFQQTDDRTVFWGNSRAIGAAITVCSRVAANGAGPTIGLAAAVDLYTEDDILDQMIELVKGKDASEFDRRDLEEDDDDEDTLNMILMNSDVWDICDLALPEGFLPVVAGMAHNGDFAHQGVWPGFWWVSVANFFFELVEFDYGKGGLGPDGVMKGAGAGILLQPRDNYIADEGNELTQADRYTAAAVQLSQDMWWRFELGLTWYGVPDIFERSRTRFAAALLSVNGITSAMTLAQLLGYTTVPAVKFFPDSVWQAEQSIMNSRGDPKDTDTYLKGPCQAAAYLSIVEPEIYAAKKYKYYVTWLAQHKDEADALHKIIKNIGGADATTVGAAQVADLFGADPSTAMKTILGVPAKMNNWLQKSQKLQRKGSRDNAAMFHFEADHPAHAAEAPGTNENKDMWLEHFEETMYEDLLMKGTAAKADDTAKTTRAEIVTPKSDILKVGLLAGAEDTPFYDVLIAVLGPKSAFKTADKNLRSKTIPLTRYIPTVQTQLTTKSAESTFAKAFPRIFEGVARVVIKSETPADDCLKVDYPGGMSKRKQTKAFCLADDDYVTSSYSNQKLKSLISFLCGPDSILSDHHAFAYHDLYHAMIFGRSMGLQMDMAGGHTTAYRDYAWIGYVVGLYHDMGYPILNKAVKSRTVLFRTNLAHIMRHNLLISGKFGNLHELASLAYLMEAVHTLNYVRTLTTGLRDEWITMEERVIMAYGILASKIGNAGVHLTSAELGSIIKAAWSKDLTSDMVGWIEKPISNAQAKDLKQGAEAKQAYDEAVQFYELVVYALSLIFAPTHLDPTKPHTYTGDVAALKVAVKSWRPSLAPYETYFEAA